jgi:spermidine synthase
VKKSGFIALLAFGSGACALVYQVAWFRLFRLVFGTSTAATAAVTAIFLGGLGIGGLVLGRRADRATNPLRLYARLELGIAAGAALSPLLIAVARSIYIGAGGTLALGAPLGTIVRLALSALGLGLPTLLMGGTLPAMVRAVESAADQPRRWLGVLYGTNTVGAVAGTIAATFWSLEHLGTRATIWVAALVNAGVAIAALALSRPAAAEQRLTGVESAACAPAWVVLSAAAVVGFAFLLMELVWYRMLGPLLGGTSYTFGLILALALAGVGLGGLVYGATARRVPTLGAFALTCALEALCIVVPYALGDDLAVFALAARDQVFTFRGLIVGWSLIGAGVICPAAIVAGYQFPLLVGLLGRGDARVGENVGRAYATNTLGAIVGSLAGGFGLLPILSAPGAWRLVVYVLAALAAAVAVYGMRSSRRFGSAVAATIVAIVAVAGCFAQGPTAFLRHSGIGAGRLHVPLGNPNEIRAAMNRTRLATFWDADGVESAVALDREDAFSFFVNGKSDGNSIGDAATQVMLGLLGAVLHPNPTRALVIGLGTGETAGWLAQVDSIERVDVFELEPTILRVADDCAPANHRVLANPKVHIVIGDARELLQTTASTYDVIASEPSNPYRAGVASLFTREFYAAAAARLNPSGIFVQWVQGYEVRADSLRSIYATLGDVFPAIETWELDADRDLAYVAGRSALVHDIARIRERVNTEPYRSALALSWGVGGVEGLYAGFLGTPEFAADFRNGGRAVVNTDDKTNLEFAFAQDVGFAAIDIGHEMRDAARERGHGRPVVINGAVDWAIVIERQVARSIAQEEVPDAVDETGDDAVNARQEARRVYADGHLADAGTAWQSQSAEPAVLSDLRLVAETLAAAGDARAPEYVEQLRGMEPVEAEALLALWSQQSGDFAAAVDHIIEAVRRYRTHPWANRTMLFRVFDGLTRILESDPDAAARVYEALAEPFSVRALDFTRMTLRAKISFAPELQRLCVPGLAPLEPNVPWDRLLLRGRAECYQRAGHPLAAVAAAQFALFSANPPPRP